MRKIKLRLLLGQAKAQMPIWRRKSETSSEMEYDESLSSVNNVRSAATPLNKGTFNEQSNLK